MSNALSKNTKNSCTQMLCNLLDQKQDYGAAILSLVERYVNHFSRCYCNLSFHEKQDISQEVAIKLLCYGHKVRENCSRSWIYALVRNQCISFVRKQTTELSVLNRSTEANDDANIVGVVPPLAEGADFGMINQIDCLQKVFDEIENQETGKVDIAIYTQYAFGLSYVEISKRSKRTVDAVGRRISLLKKRLKNLVSEHC